MEKLSEQLNSWLIGLFKKWGINKTLAYPGFLQLKNSIIVAAEKDPALVKEWLKYTRDKIDLMLKTAE